MGWGFVRGRDFRTKQQRGRDPRMHMHFTLRIGALVIRPVMRSAKVRHGSQFRPCSRILWRCKVASRRKIPFPFQEDSRQPPPTTTKYSGLRFSTPSLLPRQRKETLAFNTTYRVPRSRRRSTLPTPPRRPDRGSTLGFPCWRSSFASTLAPGRGIRASHLPLGSW